jgi:hypothetical protein
MSTRNDYTVAEWELVRRAPAESVIAIEQASPSGFWGKRQERKAALRSFDETIAQHAGLELCDAIVAARDEEGPLVDALRAGGESFVERAVETARGARLAIEAKGTPPELDAYVSAILVACEAVARASGEGNLSSNTSEAEALLLRWLAGALGRPAYEPPPSGAIAIPGQIGLGSSGDTAADAPIKRD